MAVVADIVVRNFYRLLRVGALHESVAVEPMSPYKWRQLTAMVLREAVAPAASAAVKALQYDDTFNMPSSQRAAIATAAAQHAPQPLHPSPLAHPSLRRHLERIREEEKWDETVSRETVALFDILLVSCQHLLSHGPSPRLTVRLANFLRVNAPRIDFDRVDGWLHEIQMHRLATLVGSILLTNFAMRREEVPFVQKINNKASKMMTLSLLQSSPTGQGRGLSYLQYAPLENVSVVLKSVMTRLDAMEE